MGVAGTTGVRKPTASTWRSLRARRAHGRALGRGVMMRQLPSLKDICLLVESRLLAQGEPASPRQGQQELEGQPSSPTVSNAAKWRRSLT